MVDPLPRLTHLSFDSPGSPKVPVAPGGSLLGSRKVPVAPEGSLPLPSARASPEALLSPARSPVVGALLWLPGSPKVPVAPEGSLLGSREVPSAPGGSLPLQSAQASTGALPVADSPPKVGGVLVLCWFWRGHIARMWRAVAYPCCLCDLCCVPHVLQRTWCSGSRVARRARTTILHSNPKRWSRV